MRQCEFKRKYDPELGRYVKKHIHGEGITDVLKSIGSKIFEKGTKEVAKKAAMKAAETAATKTGEFAGNKAGDKIIQLLNRKQKDPQHFTPSVNQQRNFFFRVCLCPDY